MSDVGSRRMRAKRKQDTANMAEREALEVTEIRAQIGPLFDLYMACIELINDGGPAYISDSLHDPRSCA
jgi:hypothetical protein